ncbi:nonsense-mediated mRNA decay NMD3 family protein [Tasmannia lanceolata]|uniref:nonsense-mediated mRNA decay NMD3 family protein n=1 Tax=Tasmannia lanceolata TaxID=3420 RepID=UPI0040638C09
MAEEGLTGMFKLQQTVGTVLCCMCGKSMAPNAANMCVNCLRSQVDITEGLQKHLIILHCPECNCYLQPPRTWIKAQLESKELLTFCIKRLKNLNKVRLVHAEFIWTEPHSKRIKVKLKVQKEVLNGAVLEQAYIVEYVQQEHLCESCSRVQANPDQWVASVQVRQHVAHRRTFYYLEQLILRHDAAIRAIKIKQMDQGIDFFFGNRSHAVKFVDFLGNVVPIKSRNDKQLVSHDIKSSNYNYKYTFSVEVCPICREDLICLPPKVSASLGNLGPLVFCAKVSNNILLLDPLTLRHSFMDANQYWRAPFKLLLSSRQLVEYIILDIEVQTPAVNIGGTKYCLADAQVARVSDFGKNDKIFNVRTHLGHLLNPGDYSFGYDLFGANSNDIELDKYKGLILPDAILMKKSYEEKRQKKRGKPRPWKLKNMNMEVDNASNRRIDDDKRNMEYEEFLKDLEENPEMRFNISLYRNKEYQPSEMTSVTDGDDLPSVPLEELLADLELSDEEDDTESMRD